KSEASPLSLFCATGTPAGSTSTQIRAPVKGVGAGGISPGSSPAPSDPKGSNGSTCRPSAQSQWVGCCLVSTNSKSVSSQVVELRKKKLAWLGKFPVLLS